MARVLVGQNAWTGALARYASRFDMVEVSPVDLSLPRPAGLRAWRKEVPPSFVFSVVLPRVVASLEDHPDKAKALAKSLEVANALEARCIVLRTPSSVRPTEANRARIQALFAEVPDTGWVRAWEPSGMWERADIIATAKKSQVLPVLDATRDVLPSGAIVYTRLRALGRTQLGEGAVLRITEMLSKRRESFVVVEGKVGALRFRNGLLEAMSRNAAERPASLVVRPKNGTLIAEDEEQ